MVTRNRKTEPKKSVKTKEKSNEKEASGEKLKSSSSGGIPWGGLCVAVFMLLLGLLTPPLLKPQKKAPVEYRGSDLGKSKASPRSQPVEFSGNDSTRTLQQGRESFSECNEQELSQFWHDKAVRGFHIICAEEFVREEDKTTMLRLRLFKGGTRDEKVVEVAYPIPWSELRNTLESELSLRPASERKQAWAMFSTKGERLFDSASAERDEGMYSSLLSSVYGVMLAFDGGQFLWPGVHIGFERTVDLYSVMPEGSPDLSSRNRTATLETLSLSPLVLSVKGFLSEVECDRIQTLATPTMKYSGVVLMDKDAGRPASDFRTSQSTFLAATDEVMVDIDYRTASLVRIPRNQQETVQVLRYGETEKYSSHTDYFDPALYQHDKNTLRLIENGRKNRLATVFWYLTTVEAGGHTVFPRFNGGRELSMTDCETGLKVQPEAGKVIIFYSLTMDGEMDPQSLHGACPVKEGIKWAANKWVWNGKMGYVPS